MAKPRTSDRMVGFLHWVICFILATEVHASVPDKPEDVRVVIIDETRVTVEWTAPQSGNVDHYLVTLTDVSISSGHTTIVVGGTSITYANLTPEIPYDVKVESESTGGRSEPAYTFFAIHAAKSFRTSTVYGDHMVLQSAPARAQIWGYAPSVGDQVTVTVTGATNHVTTSTTTVQRTDGAVGGLWRALLPPVKAGGPYNITITSSSGGQITLHDVLFGDVWFCSGQSNMDFPMSRVFNHSKELANSAHFQNIRILKFGTAEANETLDEAKLITVPWQKPKNDIRTGHFSAVCLMYAMNLAPVLNRPFGLIQSSWGGTKVEFWMSQDARNTCGSTRKRARPSAHGNLWNAMVYPVLNTTIYGALWYQGEANGGHPDEYYCLFPSMIDDWRQKFHDGSQHQTSRNFPFGFVQLAPSQNVTSFAFAEVRWSQTSYFGYVPNPRMKNVFMAVAIDLPDFNSPYGSIHPRDKQDVAERLALAGRAVAYGESNLDFQGPFPTTYRINGNSDIEIEFDNGNSVIDVRQTGGFEVCCGHTFNLSLCYPGAIKPAPIIKHDDSHVTINITVCEGYRPNAIQVRYLWHLSPCAFKMCPIYGRDNDLPAPPFKKDLLPGQTVLH